MFQGCIILRKGIKIRDKKIILKWILGLTILTFLAFYLIFLGLPWLLREKSEDFGNISDAERFFATMMISFWWFLGMILGAKFCTDELEELESTEKHKFKKKLRKNKKLKQKNKGL